MLLQTLKLPWLQEMRASSTAQDFECKDGWTDVRMNGWMDGRMDGWMDGWTNGWMDGWMEGGMDGRMDGWMDGWVGGWMDEGTDERMDGWRDGWMDGWSHSITFKLAQLTRGLMRAISSHACTVIYSLPILIIIVITITIITVIITIIIVVVVFIVNTHTSTLHQVHSLPSQCASLSVLIILTVELVIQLIATTHRQSKPNETKPYNHSTYHPLF